MSSQIVELAGQAVGTPAAQILDPIKKRIEQAKRDRSRLEPVWHSNRAYAAGKYWLKWSRADRRLRLDPRDEAKAERMSIDILTQNLWTALGQLAGAEAQRNLLFRREDIPSEDFTRASNDALAYGWQHEWRAKPVLDAIKRKLIVDGTAGVECYFDPTVGRELGEMPVGPEGPIMDGEQARAYMAEQAVTGNRPQLKLLKEGRICWHPLSAFQILVPPGVEDEEDFPWEATIQAVSVDKLVERYGEAARGLKEEPLAVLEQIGLKDSIESGFGSDPEGDAGQPGKLDGHVALVKYRERPSSLHPRGRVVTFCQERLLEPPTETLPYRRPNGDYHSGLVYFRYWRVEGRFWGRGLIEPGKGIQRTYNKRAQQEATTIDRGQPYVLAERGAKLKKTETPLEVVEYEQGGAPPPTGVPGIPVHDSIWRSKTELKEDLQTAMGIHAVSTGEAPSRETTYAELALRAEKDRVKLDPIFQDFQDSVAVLTELAIHDIRRYWSQDKLMAITGEEGHAKAVQLKASQIPEFFLTELADNAKPRTQAAEVQLVMDLWNADQAQMPEERRLDLSWLKESLEAGKALDFPESVEDIHEQKARWENSKLAAGEVPKPLEYDPPDVHVPIHREAQVEAEMAADEELWYRIEEHIFFSLQLQQQLAELAAQEAAQAQVTADTASAQAEGQQAEQQAEMEQSRTLELEQQRQQAAASPPSTQSR